MVNEIIQRVFQRVLNKHVQLASELNSCLVDDYAKKIAEKITIIFLFLAANYLCKQFQS